LVLLDVMLPLVDGFTICREFRAVGMKSGIILLTAKGSEEDILQGFEAGADDYVTKPFSLRLLLARIEAVLGRSVPAPSEAFVAGNLTIDPATARATCGSKGIDLSARELGILRQLAQEPGRIVSRRALLRDVWEMHNVDAVETRTVDVHVAKLRKKLMEVCSDSIESVRGQGYRYVWKGNP
jgi:DNA-binding response OmpR family regulator